TMLVSFQNWISKGTLPCANPPKRCMEPCTSPKLQPFNVNRLLSGSVVKTTPLFWPFTEKRSAAGAALAQAKVLATGAGEVLASELPPAFGTLGATIVPPGPALPAADIGLLLEGLFGCASIAPRSCMATCFCWVSRESIF